MLSAVDAPKSKSISICFFSLKNMVLAFVFTKQTHNTITHECFIENGLFITLFQISFLVAVIFDIFCLLYFYFTKAFGRLQYYVFFVFHLVFAIGSTIVTFAELGTQSKCKIKQQFYGLCFFINIIFLAASLISMWSNLYFSLKFLNLGCNIIWSFMWFIENSESNAIPSLIAVVHGLISILNFCSLNAMNFMRKNETTAYCWRYIYIFSILMMAICYILIFVVNIDSIFVETYKKLGWMELISPILLLGFLNTQLGDFRQKLIRKEADIFMKARQHENFIIDDTN